MSQIEKGDMVRIVFGCCPESIRFIGWTGIVVEIGSCIRCQACGFTTKGLVAYLPDGIDDGWVPLSWLIKIEPPTKEETETTEEELTA